MKGGGLKLHRIGHLSPSSLNLFAAAPAVWVMERLLGMRAPVGCSAHRGTAAEAGIVAGLQDFALPQQACIDLATAQFDRLTALSGDSRREKEREALPGIVTNGLHELRRYGQPTGYQGRVEHHFADLDVPIMGFFDAQWLTHGITLDIKSTLKLPGAISAAHERQVALYVHGTNYEARVAYITPAKLGVYVLHNAPQHVAALVNIARRLDRFLSVSADPQELAALLVPDLESFYLANPIAQANARQLYGFAPTAAA